MKLRAPYKAGNLVNSLATVSFWNECEQWAEREGRRTGYHGGDCGDVTAFRVGRSETSVTIYQMATTRCPIPENSSHPAVFLRCSVLNRTPSDLVEEVILLDDCSDSGTYQQADRSP
jgi:hypothetical protein